jgi:hypothetical protein
MTWNLYNTAGVKDLFTFQQKNKKVVCGYKKYMYIYIYMYIVLPNSKNTLIKLISRD